MRIDIMTLFPDAVDAMMKVSVIGRAQERGFVTIRTHQIREYTTNKQMQVDDYPYGGGRGAVMQADPPPTAASGCTSTSCPRSIRCAAARRTTRGGCASSARS